MVCRSWAAALRGLPIPRLALLVDSGCAVPTALPPEGSGLRVQQLAVSAGWGLLESKMQSVLAAVSLFQAALRCCAGQARRIHARKAHLRLQGGAGALIGRMDSMPRFGQISPSPSLTAAELDIELRCRSCWS